MARLNILPDAAFERLQSQLTERLAQIGDQVHAAEFAELLDPLMRQVLLDGFAATGAHEGTVWLVDEAGEHLEPAFNSGPQSGQIVGQFRQPLSTGLISMAFATEQPFVENDVAQNAQQSKLLDARLSVQTQALIAVPFHFLKACRGVISCVQLCRPGAAGSPAGFGPVALARMQTATALLARLLELRLLSRTVGWTCE